MQGKGVPGMTMGDWLVQMGLDQPRSDRSKGAAAPSMNTIRRHQSAMLRASTSHPRPAGRLVGFCSSNRSCAAAALPQRYHNRVCCICSRRYHATPSCQS